MIQINLLPWREQARKQQQTRFAIIVACVASLGFLCIVFFHIDYTSKIYHQVKRNKVLQEALDQESVNLKALDTQKQQLTDVDKQLHFIFALRDSAYHAVRLLNELTILNPDSVMLYKIIRTGGTILVFGKEKSNLQVTLFMERIGKSKFFKQPVLTEISGKEGDSGEERHFQLKFEQQ